MILSSLKSRALTKTLFFTWLHLMVDGDILTPIRLSAQTTCFWITQFLLLLLLPPALQKSSLLVPLASIRRTCSPTKIPDFS